MVTIYQNIFSQEPHYLTIEQALGRIRMGRSKDLVTEIREQRDKERANNLKKNLPSVCFSGKFTERKDECLVEHSGFLVLDFDDVDVLQKRNELIKNHFIFACWISPGGNGMKALVRIAEGSKHRGHFEALREIFPDCDRSGVNPSRVCYESFDEDLYLNPQAKYFTRIIEKVKEVQVVSDHSEVFKKILVWLTNRGDAFVSGERNSFTYKLASACCRFGIPEEETLRLVEAEFTESTFTQREAGRTVKSAYKSNQFNSAVFEKDVLVDRKSKVELTINADLTNPDIKPKDVIFGEDVKEQALLIYDRGYDRVDGIGCDLDKYYKAKRGEITGISGIGNYGKSSFLNWFLLVRCLKFGEKFAVFSPENNPAQEFYHDLTEIYLGCDCTPSNFHRPNKWAYEQAYDYISKKIFYVYPKELSPTPEYIKERFLELIIKEKVDGCIIDPFNQLSNDYGSRSDKYLETFLSDCSRFAQINNIFFYIVMHPKLMRKDADGNYPEPDIFDIADGAMWNNKLDNLLIYHRPNHQKDPTSSVCALHSKKIRRQKQVGIKGVIEFELFRPQRRFYFNGSDVLGKLLVPTQEEITTTWKPYKE
jgi:hypothetical protein